MLSGHTNTNRNMENESLQFEHMDELLIIYFKGLATIEQRDKARSWIKEKPAHLKYFNVLKDFYQFPEVNHKLSGYSKDKGWNRIQAGYYKEMYQKEMLTKKGWKQSPVQHFVMAVAAAVLIAFLTGTFVYTYLTNKYAVHSLVYNEIVVPLGAKSQVTLSDGTKVWLNAGSKLRYPMQFGKLNREVYLEGEGFFDVTHNKDKLFLVRTSDITIKVYGTQFNVKSYPDENKVSTTLVKGSVAIETRGNKKPPTYLKPNQTAIFYKTGIAIPPESLPRPKAAVKQESVQANDIVVAHEVDPAPVTSWKDKRWVIDSEELGKLAIILERRYNVKITIEDGDLKNYKFSGILTEETFEQVLKIIQLSAPIQFSIDHNHVIIKEETFYKKKYDNMINKNN